MKIEMFVAATSVDGRGAAGVVMVATDPHRRVQVREFAFSLIGTSTDLAHVQAARLALASVKPACRNFPTVLVTDNPILAAAVVGDAMDDSPQVVELRRWCGYYANLDVEVVAVAHHRLDRAQQLADGGTSHDSLTRLEK